MADINQEQKYLLYGQDEISQQDLMTGLANDLPTYLNSKRWLQNPKYRDKWMTAYQDIINHGITGASSESGQWKIKYNGNRIDTDSMSNIDKEIYADAAWYIQNKMSQMTPRKKEEEVKKELEPFDFKTSFGKQLLNLYGGDKEIFSDSEQGWNSLDARGNDGLRDTKERRRVMAKQLELYKKDLEGKDYNFEGTSFKDKNDVLTKLQAAIDALGTDEESDDLPAFSALGLNYRNFFSNGGNEYTNNINPQTGNPYTYSQWNQLQKQQAEDKAKQAAALREANYANQYKNYRYYNYLNGTPSNQEDFNNIALKLANNQQLDGNDISRISWAFRQAEKSGGLQNLSKEELQLMPRYVNNPSRLKKINGLDGIYYDSIARRIVQPQRELNSNGITLQSILDQNSPEALAKKKNQVLKENLQHKLGKGLTDDMKVDLAAMGLDLVSAGAAFAPGYGTLASAVTGIGSTVAGAVSDRMRGESWGSTLGTAGFGLSMDILGLIPGVGIGAKAAKIAKVVSKGAKWIGPALGGLAAMSYGPGALSAYKKFTSGKEDDITAEELRDFTYAIRAIAAGGIRKAGATYQGNRTMARAIKKGKAEISTGKQSASITTKNGQVELSDEEFKTLSSNATREKKIELLKSKGIKEEDIEWKGLNPAKGRFKTPSKSSKLSGLQEGTESNRIKWNTTSNDYKGIRRFSNENLLRGFTTMSSSNSRLWKSIKDRWTGQDILNRPQNQSSTTPFFKESQKLLPFIKGKYNAPKTESQEIIPISRALPQPGGTHKGNVIDNTRPGTINTNKITLGDANQEFNDFHRMYIASTRKNSKVPSKPFSNGYGSSKEPENGSINFNGITATLTKLDDNKGFSITFGKTDDTVIAKQYKSIQQLRSNFAKQLNEVIKNQDNVKETAALLRQFKAKGWLKQGGQINPSIDTIIEDFIKNNNI